MYDGLVKVSNEILPIDLVKQNLRVVGKGYQNSIKIVDCFEQDASNVYLPAVYANEKGYLNRENDNRPVIKEIWPDSPELTYRHNQAKVVEDCLKQLKKTGGCLMDSPTDFGKTITSLKIAKDLNAKVLFLCHKTDVLKQTAKTAKKFFNVKDIGFIQGSKETLGIITFSTMQTAAKRIENADWKDKFSMIIFDEVHRASCNSYVEIMKHANCQYRLGLSATYTRSDKLEKVYENFLGSYTIKGIKSKTKTPILEFPNIETNLTTRDFMDWQGEIQHTKALTKISEDRGFNNWLTNRIKQLVQEGRKPILCTDRKEQLETLEFSLHKEGIKCGIYAGGKYRGIMTQDEIYVEYEKWFKKSERKKYLSKMVRKHELELIKTYKYIYEIEDMLVEFDEYFEMLDDLLFEVEDQLDKMYETHRKELTKKKAEFNKQYELPPKDKKEIDNFYKNWGGATIKGRTLTPEMLTNAILQPVILATTKKIGEGFDTKNYLTDEQYASTQEPDTIILASLTKDSRQVIGRVSRDPESPKPLIIHPVLDIQYCRGMFNACYKIAYKKFVKK